MNSTDVPVDVPIHHVSAFDIEDAFSDGEDIDHTLSFDLSVEHLREELARNMTAETNDDDSTQNGSLQNTSVSTLDINQDTLPSPAGIPSSNHEPYSLDEADVAHFSQVSLTPSDEDIHEEGNGSLEPPDSPADDQPYPSVVIDASQPPNHRIADEEETTPSIPPLNIQYVTNGSTLPTSSSSQANGGLPSDPKPDSPKPSAVEHPPSQVSTSPQSPPATGPQPPKTHRPTRSVGPSALEKVRSKTRPTFLPPKNRQEDDKHMADWEDMMKQSRSAAEKRRKALQERRLAREAQIEASLHTWEKEIVPDWRVVYKNPSLRKLWWKGIPTKLRASMWEKAVGNALALSKDHYRTCFARAKRALTAGNFPQPTLNLIEQDMATTLPALHIFHRENGPMYGDLRDMLCAWVVSRSDEGLGYTMGASKVAAMLLLNLPVQQAFVVMRNLLERHCMRSFFGGDGAKDDVEAYFRIFDTLLADGMPKVYFNFKQHQISPSAYFPSWVIPLFLDHLPFEACARLWDVILLEGDAFLYRAALGILGVLEPRLFFPDRKELLELLRGENKAAITVAQREGRPLDGGKYEIYGLDEETLWERIDSMEDWWKETTWTRLIRRELPDL
ncbi:RabGAP/TBC [Pluteus cervinus]|uniref:RabGAP/TBC n=1 Tax=Pluteus cervinus TaxID=181527 RepID=A0ACD3BHR5_9AGAR|nr:RabGAP/TBC [Pluteus cervinus]